MVSIHQGIVLHSSGSGSTSVCRQQVKPALQSATHHPRTKSHWTTIAGVGCALAIGHLALPHVADAHVRTDGMMQSGALRSPTEENTSWNIQSRMRSYEAFSGRSAAQRPSSSDAPSTASRAKDALALLEQARGAVSAGDYTLALKSYEDLIKSYGDLALAEYARMGRAVMLYQVGRTSDALLQLDDEQVSMVGSAEVHAALAAILYVERPYERLRSEQEWDVANEFDKRYRDVAWVRDAKHWPPKALDALQRFLELK